MPAVRFGLIGAGGIAEYTARDILGHPDAAIVAIADPSRARAEALAERCHAVALADPAELLDLPDVDAVYIAVPNRLHAPLACAALVAGKHVLLEKPFATSLAEAEETAAVAERSGRLLMLGMNQTAFAQFIGTTQAAVSQYERGIRRPQLDVALTIRAKTGVTLDWLYEGDRSGLPLHLAAKLPMLSPSDDTLQTG